MTERKKGEFPTQHSIKNVIYSGVSKYQTEPCPGTAQEYGDMWPLSQKSIRGHF